MMGPIRQSQEYHRFADGRVFLGIENAADVLSSAAFIAVGLTGLFSLWRHRARSEAREELRPYWALFGAVALAGVGSVYYHLVPDDARLVWDRLPIAVAFLCLLAAIIAERISVKAGIALLVPFVALGAASVLYWAAFDDLRLYALVQFGSLAAILALCAFFPSRYSRGELIFVAAALYGIAKVLEWLDRAVFELTGGMLSGHTLKHLLAASALYLILWGLERREAVVNPTSSARPRH